MFVRTTEPWQMGSLVVLMVYLSYVYVGMEWLFFITKPSFMDSFVLLNRIGSLLNPALVLWLLCIPCILLLGAIEKLTHTKGLMLLVPTFILGSLFFLLADNFFYTTLDIGTIQSGRYSRFLVLAGYLFVLAKTYGWVKKWAAHFRQAKAKPWLIAPAGLCLATSIGMIGVTLFTTNHRLADVDVDLSAHAQKRPNIIFLASDGIESRYLSVYGHQMRTTPFLGRFSPRTVLFENAFANAAKSTGSTTSMLSGKLPTTLKVGFPPQVLSKSHAVQHLPAMLRKLGYVGFQQGVRYYIDSGDVNMQSGFHVANGRQLMSPLPGSFGAKWMHTFNTEHLFSTRMIERLSQRLFHIFGIKNAVNHFLLVKENTGQAWQRDADAIEAAIAFIQKQQQPFFMHLHLMATHCCGYRGGKSQVFEDQLAKRLEREARRNKIKYQQLSMVARYFDAIRNADELFERLISWLDETGTLSNTILVISSDHTRVWGTTERVPLLVHFPGEHYTGRVRDNVSLIDLAPTILDYMGVAIPDWMDGDSLITTIDAPWSPILASDTGRLKPILTLEKFQYTRFALQQGVLSRIDHPGPPLYGVAGVGLIVCNQWKKIALQTGQITSGLVAGHTAPCPEPFPLKDAEIRAFVAQELNAAGLTTPIWSATAH